MVRGVEHNELAVQFTTKAKFRPDELTARGLTPLPKKLQLEDGRWVPTDVGARRFRRGHRITTSKRPTSRRSLEALANHDRQVRHEPLLGGISVSVASGTA